ncbi:hypothetical protein B0H14DRAFT_2774321 [Mycena olivaceomarginata]|nr:hypothetical protein B0H14DRAFT_2774321 [Mycena olivaceomarginata]
MSRMGRPGGMRRVTPSLFFFLLSLGILLLCHCGPHVRDGPDDPSDSSSDPNGKLRVYFSTNVLSGNDPHLDSAHISRTKKRPRRGRIGYICTSFASVSTRTCRMYHTAHQEGDDTPAYSIVDDAERQNAIHKG